MRAILLILPIFLMQQVQAQVPRNTSGFYEYASEITVHTAPDVLKQKAAKFFNHPFLVHWDSVSAQAFENNATIVRGLGYINITTREGRVSIFRKMGVSVQFVLEVKEGGYYYSFRHFTVRETEARSSFALEKKPDDIKPIVYDQLLKKTHQQISFVIGWLKRYMEEESAVGSR